MRKRRNLLAFARNTNVTEVREWFAVYRLKYLYGKPHIPAIASAPNRPNW